MPQPTDHIAASRRPITGRTVLLWLLTFFAIVFGVNGVMIRAATKSFGGVETESSYKAGLAFKQEMLDAERQDALHWQVDGTAKRATNGEVTLDIVARGSGGEEIRGWTVSARLAHPADARLDESFSLDRLGPDRARGITYADKGQWDLVIEIDRDGERAFRSRNRIVFR